jgi:hypothetical protein
MPQFGRRRRFLRRSWKESRSDAEGLQVHGGVRAAKQVRHP